MAKKTLYVFRAENGIWRKELSEKIGIDEKTLKEIEDKPEVPSEIAEKVIATYNLAEDYFTVDPKDKRYKPRNPFKYFLKVAIIWELLIALIFKVAMIPTDLAGIIGSGENPLFNILGTICEAMIISFSGVYLTAYIVKKTVYGKQLTQYDYIYPFLPAQITVCLGIVIEFATNAISQKTDNKILLLIAGYAIGTIVLLIQGIITAKLLESRIEEHEKQRQKTIKIMSVLAVVSSAIYAMFCIFGKTGITKLFLINLCVELVLLIAVAFGLIIGEKKWPRYNKLWFKVLPISAMLLPTFISVADSLFQ